MQPIVFVLFFLAVLFALEGVSNLLRAGRRGGRERVRERLDTLAKGKAPQAAERASMIRGSDSEGSWLEALAGMLPRGDSIELLLYRAGLSLTPTRFLLICVGMALIGWFVATSLSTYPFLGIVGIFAGLIPYVAVRRAASRRKAKFAEQLPEALELVTRALRAGHALTTGFKLVGEELDDPVGTEFALVAEEIRFGIDLRDALHNLAHRTDNQDLPYFVTAVLIQRQTGGNLAELLDNLSGLLRERQQFYGRVRALTAQGRGAALVLALWLPFITILVAYLVPDYLAPLFENTWGHALLATVAAIDVIAYAIARRIANVEL